MPIEKLVELVKELTLEEKCNLLSGKDTWRTYDVPRLGIPSLKVFGGHLNGPNCSFLTVRTELVAIPSLGWALVHDVN
jgi:beta-glucosidase